MNITGKLEKKNFKADNGETRDYYVITYNLGNGETLDVSIKGDKAKLILLSAQIAQQGK